MFERQYQNHSMIVTSDHGEYWGEHGLLDHGRTVYPEVLQVPLLVVDSASKKAEKKNNLVSNKDIFSLVHRYATKGTLGGALFDNDATKIFAGAEKRCPLGKKIRSI